MADPSSLRLRIVPVDDIRLHEAHEAQRVDRIIRAMRRDGFQRNPIIVTEHQESLIQLDGATRVIALRKMEIPHIAVQIVGYSEPEICLSRWYHVLIDYPAQQLCSELAATSGLSCSTCHPGELDFALRSRPAPTATAKRPQAILGVISREGECTLIQSDEPALRHPSQLADIVERYRGRGEVRRTADSALDVLLNQHPDLTAVVAFAQLHPEDVLHCAFNKTKLPMGITRHIVNGRALGLDVPLDLLAEDRSVEAKNAWLQDMVLERIRQHKVRMYQEPVIIFDD